MSAKVGDTIVDPRPLLHAAANKNTVVFKRDGARAVFVKATIGTSEAAEGHAARRGSRVLAARGQRLAVVHPLPRPRPLQALRQAFTQLPAARRRSGPKLPPAPPRTRTSRSAAPDGDCDGDGADQRRRRRRRQRPARRRAREDARPRPLQGRHRRRRRRGRLRVPLRARPQRRRVPGRPTTTCRTRASVRTRTRSTRTPTSTTTATRLTLHRGVPPLEAYGSHAGAPRDAQPLVLRRRAVLPHTRDASGRRQPALPPPATTSRPTFLAWTRPTRLPHPEVARGRRELVDTRSPSTSAT